MLLLILSMGLHAQNSDDREKAIEKGKSDLVEILSISGKDFNFGLEAESIKRATPAKGIPYVEADFKDILNYEEGNFEIDSEKPQKLVVPLLQGNEVLTTLSISNKDKNSYEVTELINGQYATDLNMLPVEARENKFEGVRIVYVPNLNTLLYYFKDKIHTSYKDFSLRQGVEPQIILEKLKIDAIDFQEKYGEILKTKKLVE